MRMPRGLWAVIAVLVLAWSGKQLVEDRAMPGATQPTPDRIEIRVRNASSADFEHVVVTFPNQHRVDYGRVRAGEVSDYRSVEQAYRYAGIAASAGARELTLAPIDYVGERPLDPGRYTYVLGRENDRLTLSLQREQ